jgi:hypothetical protein
MTQRALAYELMYYYAPKVLMLQGVLFGTNVLG